MRPFAACALVSDNESWQRGGRSSPTNIGWESPSPKLVCIDIQPYGSTPTPK